MFGGAKVSIAAGDSLALYGVTAVHVASNYITTFHVYAINERGASDKIVLNGWKVIALEEIMRDDEWDDDSDLARYSLQYPEITYTQYQSIMTPVSLEDGGNISASLAENPRSADDDERSLRLLADIYFASGSLNYENSSELTQLSQSLLLGTGVYYFVAGYTETMFIENEGINSASERNSTVRLSRARAEKISLFLESQGILSDQISIQNYGSPLPTYKDIYYKPKSNSRVEVYIYE